MLLTVRTDVSLSLLKVTLPGPWPPPNPTSSSYFCRDSWRRETCFIRSVDLKIESYVLKIYIYKMSEVFRLLFLLTNARFTLH